MKTPSSFLDEALHIYMAESVGMQMGAELANPKVGVGA